jgi:hypothetical protein
MQAEGPHEMQTFYNNEPINLSVTLFIYTKKISVNITLVVGLQS